MSYLRHAFTLSLLALCCPVPRAYGATHPPLFKVEHTATTLSLYDAKTQQMLWKLQHSPQQPAVAFAQKTTHYTESRGSFQGQTPTYSCQGQFPIPADTATQLLFAGDQRTWHGPLQGKNCTGTYQIHLTVHPPKTPQAQASVTLRLEGPSNMAQTRLHFYSRPGPYYGLGTQFDPLPLAGSYPLVVQEGGIGRGAQPLSTLIGLVSPGSSGSEHSSYFPLPVMWSPLGPFFHASGHRLGTWHIDSTTASFSLETEGQHLELEAFTALTPLHGLTQFTATAGRPPLLPDWLHQGALVGMQGGDERVQQVFSQFKDLRTPLAGFWLQDWVGKRKTAIGSQLWWNWELNRDHYPRWSHFRQQLNGEGQQLLGYINPFLVDVPHPVGHSYYQEALAKGYFVKDHTGAVYPVQNTDFSAGLLDLTHPEVRQWIKSIIRKQLIQEAGFKAWMADYAEALPLDAVLFAGEGRELHNAYPALWAQVNAEAIQEAGCTDCSFFMRAGYNQSLATAPLFWTGDQMVSWDAQDGMASALQGILSGGLSGIALNHSDAGGYTSVGLPGGGGLVRSQELLYRWLEMNAFTTLLRTHEGNQPEHNAQIYDSPHTLRFFDHCARMYAALFDYRKTLLQDAHDKGWPVVRHMVLHYPADLTAQKLNDQFMLGSELLVAPILRAGQRQRKVYLPAGNWVHLWSNTPYRSAGNRWVEVDAPLGYPPVFYVEGSAQGKAIQQGLSTLPRLNPSSNP